MPSISEITKKIDRLPTMPAVVSRLIELTADEHADINEILDLIKQDASLTAQLLKLCNSPYYGISKHVSSLKDATVMLGFNKVSRIVISLGPSKFFRRDMSVYGISGSEQWRHSIGTAFTCELLADQFHPDKSAMAYTAGLLHDVGKIVLSEYFDTDLSQVLDELVRTGTSFIEAEREILGSDHARVGGKVARNWRFPAPLVEAIKHHHEPDLATVDPDLCELTHLGNIISNGIGAGVSLDAFSNRQSHSVLEKYNLDDEQLDQMLLTARNHVDVAAAVFWDLETSDV